MPTHLYFLTTETRRLGCLGPLGACEQGINTDSENRRNKNEIERPKISGTYQAAACAALPLSRKLLV